MILDLDDSCWTHADADWQRSLIEFLMLVKRHESHSVLAASGAMLPWCAQHLSLFTDYFRTRLAVAQPRTKALKVVVSPTGAAMANGAPPWTLNANATGDLINRPLQLILEDDGTDHLFLTSTIPSFSTWCAQGRVTPVNGGGSRMAPKISAAGADPVARWRTFFVFDSDRLHPSEFATGWAPPAGDSCQGHQFELLCTAIPRDRWHRLERRSIENYLPEHVLRPINSTLTVALLSSAVGEMSHFYNMKYGLKGDGVSPASPNLAARAGRSQGRWSALPPGAVADLEPGFGRKVADEFNNVPMNYAWPASVVDEMSALADAIQDAM